MQRYLGDKVNRIHDRLMPRMRGKWKMKMVSLFLTSVTGTEKTERHSGLWDIAAFRFWHVVKE